MIDTLQEQEREQLVRFLKENSILRLIDDDRIVYGLSLSLEELQCGPGFIVFVEGDPGDGLYIVKEGSVEVRRSDDPTPVAYLTAGECFGEMSLVNSTPRTATIRVPEEAVILKLSKKASLDLKSKFPKLSEELVRLAQQRDSGKPLFCPPGLQGNTAFFDLPTVIQAVASSRQSGKLNILATPTSPAAKMVFERGLLITIEFRHLTRDYAFFELIANEEPADFVFERSEEPDTKSPPQVTRQIDTLLIEGARRADEMQKLSDSIICQGSFSTAAKMPNWTELPEEVRDLAPKIWRLVELELTAEEMFPLLPVDRYSVVQALAEMLSLGVVEQVQIPPSSAPDPEESRPVRGVRDTAEIDLRKLLKQSTKLARTLYALNMVASNLANIVNTTLVQSCLEEALLDSAKKYPQLSCLKVHAGGKTLDVRGASSELSNRGDSSEGLTFMTNRFLQLMAEKPSS